MEAPTDKEISLIKQLRQRVSDLNLDSDERYQSDMFYVRWIRARDQKLDQAETMLRKSMEWRKSFDVDNIHSWTPPDLLNTEFAIEFLGYSNNNCATYYIPMGCCDFKRVCDLGLKQAALRYFLQMFESAMRMSTATNSGRNGQAAKGQVLVLADFKDFSVAAMLYPSVIDLCYQVGKHFEANFPETMFKCVFFNSGRGLQIAMNIMRPILSPKTLDKIIILTETAYQLLPEIHGLFPEDELPPPLGGSAAEIQDRMLAKCESFKRERSKTLANMQAMLRAETATVAAGHQVFLEIPVKVPGTKLSFVVSVDKHDVDFRIFRGVKEFVAKRRISSKSEAESGEIVCDKPGTFIVNFDNSYSNYRSKQVNFKISVTEP